MPATKDDAHLFNDLPDISPTVAEVCNVLKRLKSHKASGFDDITNSANLSSEWLERISKSIWGGGKNTKQIT